MGGRGPAPSGRPIAKKGSQAAPRLVSLPPLAKGEVEVPDLPRQGDGGPWHEMTVWWWEDVWASPMAREFTEPDVHGLYRLAMIVDAFWTHEHLPQRLSALAEIRLQSASFGLTPLDRSRLRWEVERGDAAEKRTFERRKSAEDAAKVQANAGDPRAAFRN